MLAGKNVAHAFGIREDYLVWGVHDRGFDVVVIPHPSGVNHWWNDPDNRDRFRRFAERVLRGGQ